MDGPIVVATIADDPRLLVDTAGRDVPGVVLEESRQVWPDCRRNHVSGRTKCSACCQKGRAAGQKNEANTQALGCLCPTHEGEYPCSCVLASVLLSGRTHSAVRLLRDRIPPRRRRYYEEETNGY
jgi:hypothetical protein